MSARRSRCIRKNMQTQTNKNGKHEKLDILAVTDDPMAGMGLNVENV